MARAEEILLSPPDPGPGDRLLLTPLVRDGVIVGRESLDAARDRHRQVLAELPPQAFQLSLGDPAIPSVLEGEPPDQGIRVNKIGTGRGLIIRTYALVRRQVSE